MDGSLSQEGLLQSVVSFDALCGGSLGAEGVNIVTKATHAELMYSRLSRPRCGGILDEFLSAGAHIRVLNVRCRSGAGITVWDSTN